jgi:hypothetical protein
MGFLDSTKEGIPTGLLSRDDWFGDPVSESDRYPMRTRYVSIGGNVFRHLANIISPADAIVANTSVTATVLTLPLIEGLTFIVQLEISPGIPDNAYSFEPDRTFPEAFTSYSTEPWERTSTERQVSPALQEAVDNTLNIIKEFPVKSIDNPQIEEDPEVENDWWISIPVWCHGTVEEVFRTYKAIIKKFVVEVTPPQRERIRIDIRISE